MKIDKLFDEICEMYQKQKKTFNDMNVCATKTFNAQGFSDLIDEYNKSIHKIFEIQKQLITMRDKNLESMRESLRQHYGIKSCP